MAYLVISGRTTNLSQTDHSSKKCPLETGFGCAVRAEATNSRIFLPFPGRPGNGRKIREFVASARNAYPKPVSALHSKQLGARAGGGAVEGPECPVTVTGNSGLSTAPMPALAHNSFECTSNLCLAQCQVEEKKQGGGKE